MGDWRLLWPNELHSLSEPGTKQTDGNVALFLDVLLRYWLVSVRMEFDELF